jgi:hypothetical protein
VTKHLQTLAFVFVFALASTAIVATQEKEKPPAPAPKPPAALLNVTPLKAQVVIARYQGEKKISSMPYTLTVNAGGHSNLRMGAKIPVVVNFGKSAAEGAPYNYQDVGTNIDCITTALDDGRFLLAITIDDSSVYSDEPPAGSAKGPASFRSFRANNSMVLRNGETGQFTTATDKVTGETVKVDVTLTVMK